MSERLERRAARSGFVRMRTDLNSGTTIWYYPPADGSPVLRASSREQARSNARGNLRHSYARQYPVERRGGVGGLPRWVGQGVGRLGTQVHDVERCLGVYSQTP